MKAPQGINISADSGNSSGHSDGELWRSIRAIPQPDNYWAGRRIHSGLAPDNVLLFPYLPQPTPANENYGNFHPRFVLDVAFGRSVVLHLDGVDYRLEAGECALVFPHQFHLARSVDSSVPDSQGWAVLTFDLRNSELVECLRNSPRKLRARERALLGDFVESYRQEESGLDLASRVAHLLLSLREAPEIPAGRRNLPSPEPERDAFLEKVNRNLEHHTSPTALARALHLSESQLKSQFRKHIGRSPGDYIRRNRLSRAVRLLQLGEANIGEISEQLGFSSVHAFSRMFKAVYGLPPKQYEKLLRENTGGEKPGQ